MIRLLRFLLGWRAVLCSGLYVSSLVYPASPRAFWYSSLVSVNVPLELEMALSTITITYEINDIAY